jgi:hypothetical protein
MSGGASPSPSAVALASSSPVVGTERVKPGKVLFLHEVLAEQRNLAGKSVRVIGRLVNASHTPSLNPPPHTADTALPLCARCTSPVRLSHYQADDDMATLSMQSSELRVSTHLLSSFQCRVGGVVRVIGEVEWREGMEGDAGEVRVIARVCAELQEWDMELYEKVVKRKRNFETRLGLH